MATYKYVAQNTGDTAGPCIPPYPTLFVSFYDGVSLLQDFYIRVMCKQETWKDSYNWITYHGNYYQTSPIYKLVSFLHWADIDWYLYRFFLLD